MALSRSPYPGLRSFARDEAHLFFGRSENIDEILQRLGQTRFIAVLGSSGSGKSSLVRTGVLDALESGFMPGVSVAWQFVDFHPGESPMANLARGLLQRGDPTQAVDDNDVRALSGLLRQGPFSLVDWCSDGNLKPNTNLLLFADQFEELFRYDSYKSREEAQAFTSLLIESARQRKVPIYVILTMRSEYLGASALLQGLAEQINSGQYLVPRLSRDQCREAIASPARTAGGRIADELVNRILNDLAAFAPWDDAPSEAAAPQPSSRSESVGGQVAQLDRLARRADQLPLMQQALSRLWVEAQVDGRSEIMLSDYQAVGGLDGSFTKQAEDVARRLVAAHGEEVQHSIEAIFRELVDGSSIADAVRRPRAFHQLAETLGKKKESVARDVVEAYRAEGVNFLRPPSDEPLVASTEVDISHESLIRQWPLLVEWVEDEAKAATWWRRLDEAARLHAEGESDLLRNIELRNSYDEYRRRQPTREWAARYGGNYDRAIGFLRDSEDAAELEESRRQEQERQKQQAEAARRDSRNWKRFAFTVAATCVAGIVVAIWSNQQIQAALTVVEEQNAKNLATAADNRKEADENKQASIENRAAADRLFDAAVGIGLDGLVKDQADSNWDRAAIQIGWLFDNLTFDATGKARLSNELRAPLERVLKVQYLQLQSQRNVGSGRGSSTVIGRQRGNNWALAHDRDGRLSRLAIVRGRSLEILEQPDRSPDGKWTAVVRTEALKFLGERTALPPLRGITFYGVNRLAVVFDGEMFLGSAEQLQAGTSRRTKLFPDGESQEASVAREGGQDAEKGREYLNSSDSGDRVPDRSSLLSFHSCNVQGTSFIGLADEKRLYRIDVPSDTETDGRRRNAVWTPLTGRKEAAVIEYAVDPADGRFAMVDAAGRLKIGKCGERELLEVAVPGLPTLSDVGFITPNLIGVAAKSTETPYPMDRVAYLKRGADGEKWTLVPGDDGKATDGIRPLQPGARFVDFVDERRVWVATGSGSKVYELWDTTAGVSELHVVSGSNDAFIAKTPAGILTSRSGALAFHRALRVDAQSTKLMIGLIAMWRPATVAAKSDELTRVVSGELLKASGATERHRNTNAAGHDTTACNKATLERLTAVLERERLGLRYGHDASTARIEAQAIRDRCAQAEGAEAGLVRSWSTAIEKSDDWKANRGADAIESIIVAAAGGRHEAMRLLAVLLDRRAEDGIPAGRAALAIRKLVVADGAAVPLALVDRARAAEEAGGTDFQLDKDIAEIVKRQPCSPHGTDQEYLAMVRFEKESSLDAIVHYARAVRLYSAAGDPRSAEIADRAKRRLVGLAGTGTLLEAWTKIDSCPDATPQHKATAGAPRGPDSVDAAARVIADRIADPVARSEFLWMVLDRVPGSNPAYSGLRRFALDTLTKVGPDDRAKAAEIAFAVDGKQETTPDRAVQRSLDTFLAFEATGVRPSEWELAWLTEVMRKLAVAEASLLADKKSDFERANWRFLWSTSSKFSASLETEKNAKEYAAFLEATLDLQARLAAGGIQSDAFEVGRLVAQFWAGHLVLASTLPRNMDALVNEVAYQRQQSEGAPPVMLLQRAEWLWWASTLMVSSDTLEDYRQRKAFYSSMYDLYDLVPKSQLQSDGDYYIVAATVSGRSRALHQSAEAEMFAAVKEDGDAAAAAAARSGLELLWRQHALFSSGQFARVHLDKRFEKEGFCCLKPDPGVLDGALIGLLAGMPRLQRIYGRDITSCERRVNNPFDPQRRTKGVGTFGVVSVEELIADCTTDLNTVGNPRAYYLLGRLYQHQGSRGRNEALEKLVAAAALDYSIAYNNLAGLMDFNRCPQLVRPMRDHYRSSMINKHLRAAGEVVAQHLSEDRKLDVKLLDWLQDKARSGLSDGKSEGGRTWDVSRLDVDDIRRICGWRD